ncbi:MAG TPA: hypothetical protein VM364_16960 [Vicinamibacterales bacterium]|nr:hypothetical protein [Vicinamibacterales bacterium]
MVLWGFAGVALLIALAALLSARRASRKLEALTQSYWELRYDFTRLRSVVSRLDPEEPEDAPAAPAPPPSNFIPLSSIKKKNG